MGRYTYAYASPNGAGDSRPTAIQILQDEEIGDKLVGKVIVITGATSGLGLETARALSTTGAVLVLAVRDLDQGQIVLQDILKDGRHLLVQLDVESLSSVRAAAKTILTSSKNQVNILINNAGIMGIPKLELTADGHEKLFATNYLGHFLLFQLLKQALLNSSTPEFQSRVVNVSSSCQRAGDLSDRENYNSQKGYDHSSAYNNSKLAMVYMTNEIERRYSMQNLHGLSLHPGVIAATNIGRYADPDFVKGLLNNEALQKVFLSAEQGAASAVYAAISADWEGKGGRYLENCEEARRGPDDGSIFTPGYSSQTYDSIVADRLWTDSLKLVGIDE